MKAIGVIVLTLTTVLGCQSMDKIAGMPCKDDEISVIASLKSFDDGFWYNMPLEMTDDEGNSIGTNHVNIVCPKAELSLREPAEYQNKEVSVIFLSIAQQQSPLSKRLKNMKPGEFIKICLPSDYLEGDYGVIHSDSIGYGNSSLQTSSYGF